MMYVFAMRTHMLYSTQRCLLGGEPYTHPGGNAAQDPKQKNPTDLLPNAMNPNRPEEIKVVHSHLEMRESHDPAKAPYQKNRHARTETHRNTSILVLSYPSISQLRKP
jgi:hypothetical protein